MLDQRTPNAFAYYLKNFVYNFLREFVVKIDYTKKRKTKVDLVH
jgi:hypothetical protein